MLGARVDTGLAVQIFTLINYKQTGLNDGHYQDRHSICHTEVSNVLLLYIEGIKFVHILLSVTRDSTVM